MNVQLTLKKLKKCQDWRKFSPYTYTIHSKSFKTELGFAVGFAFAFEILQSVYFKLLYSREPFLLINY